MDIEKRQKLIEILLAIGSLVGTFLAIFQMSTYVFTMFSLFILFSLIYYISALEDYKKTLHNIFVTFMVSISFSGLLIILLARGMTGNNIFDLVELTAVFGILSFLLTIELSGYSIDIHMAKKENMRTTSHEK